MQSSLCARKKVVNCLFRKMSAFGSGESVATVRSTAASGSQVYESKRAVHEYLLFHYGKKEDQFPYGLGATDALDFPARCAQVCIEQVKTPSLQKRALDIGCAVGASSFELARHYDEVVGVDFSQHFVDAANVMKVNGRMEFNSLVRGNVFKACETLSIKSDIDRARVSFQQGDACNLSSSIGDAKIFLLYCTVFSPEFLRCCSLALCTPSPHCLIIYFSNFFIYQEHLT